MARSLTLVPVIATPPSSLFTFNRLHHLPSPYSPSGVLRATAKRFTFVTKSKSVTTMAAVQEYPGNLKRQVEKLFDASLRSTVPDETGVETEVTASLPGKPGDYQWFSLPLSFTSFKFLFEKFPDTESVTETAIGDLQSFYKESKSKFDADPEFKEKAQKAVVRLQGGDAIYRKAWTKICDISRAEFAKVYQRLRVELEEKGESFYNPYIAKVIEELNSKGLIEESEGARVIFLEGFNIPLMVVKSDGGFNYASTDLTALWYRLNEEKAEWIVYVTDVGQQQHFSMFFKAARKAGWLPESDKAYPRVDHVGFGLVKGEDGKRFRTRSSEVVRLVDLLDEAKTRSKTALIERGKDKEWTPEELDQTAEAVGYGAVKYADLKNNRSTSYTFNFDQMLSDKGNTAVYLLYAHARICSIIRKSGKDIDELKKTGKLALDHPEERALGLHLLRFAETVEAACANLLPHALCEYLYELSERYTSFYSVHQVIGSAEEASRLLLCEATAIVMRKCFHLLGITPVYKI